MRERRAVSKSIDISSMKEYIYKINAKNQGRFYGRSEKSYVIRKQCKARYEPLRYQGAF